MGGRYIYKVLKAMKNTSYFQHSALHVLYIEKVPDTFFKKKSPLKIEILLTERLARNLGMSGNRFSTAINLS